MHHFPMSPFSPNAGRLKEALTVFCCLISLCLPHAALGGPSPDTPSGQAAASPDVHAGQSVVIPDTPAGQALAAWLDAFNSADATRMDAYSDKYQTGTPLSQQMPFRMRTGGFDVTEIRLSEPRSIEFSVKERASPTRGIGRLTLTATDPPRVGGFSLLAIAPGETILGFQIDAQTRNRVIDASIAKLQEIYVFPATAKRMEEALRRHQKHGDYDSVTDGNVFANLLTTHLRDVSHDKHLRVRFSPARLPESLESPTPQQIAQRQRMLERNNCGFDKVEVLPGNVGYLKFDGFNDPTSGCGQTAVAAMNFLANSDALIFDLRNNGGGDPAMIALICTYLFAGPTHLNDIWNRKDDKTTQYWTLPFVPGKRLPGVPVYVLTSSFTFSGAEEFSYDLQSLKRAIIVGEVTGGGAHPVAGQRIDDRFIVYVPFARAINPVTKTNWEGVGVQPDVKAPASDALATAQKLAEKLTSSQAAKQ